MIYQEGNYYHIFNRGCNKDNIFFSERGYNNLLSRMQQTKKAKNVEIIAYCLMPNHYHFLLYQNSENPVSNWLKSLFSGYVQWMNRRYDRSGTLFERSAKPKLVSKDNYLVELIHYIHANPLKHSFVINPEDWKYSSLADYVDKGTSKLTSKRVILEYFSDDYNYQESFHEYIECKKFEEEI